jgi:hypothetical protein
LSATIIDHLQQVFGEHDIAILYIYCDYKDKTNQQDRNLFANLAKQSILQQTKLSNEALALYSHFQKGETSPSAEQCLDLLKVSMTRFRRTFIVIDALDEHLSTEEYGYSPEIPLLSKLITFQHDSGTRCAICVTSRGIDAIQEELHGSTRIDIRAHDEDIRSYLNSRVRDVKKFRFARELQTDPVNAEKIVNGLVGKAQGM